MKRIHVPALALAVASVMIATASAAPPPGRRLKTGAKICWTEFGATVPCSGTGQDGDLRKGLARSYADQGDGTIVDQQTGLQWEKLDDAGGPHDRDARFTWANALAHVAALNAGSCFAGYCDWRLPNVNELQSLIDFGRQSPAVQPAFATPCASACGAATCSCTALEYYWSSTTRATPSSLDEAWMIEFTIGSVSWNPKTATRAVRAVRGGAPSDAAGSGARLKTGQRKCWNAAGQAVACGGTGQDGDLRKGLPRTYVDNGDGTIIDPSTGLQWEKLDDAGGVHDKDEEYTWKEAFAHVGELNTPPCFAQRCDWRFPNVNELQSILDYGKAKPVPPAFKTPCTPGCASTVCSCTTFRHFWTSSSFVDSHSDAWTVDSKFGLVATDYKPNPTFKVRAVRAG